MLIHCSISCQWFDGNLYEIVLSLVIISLVHQRQIASLHVGFIGVCISASLKDIYMISFECDLSETDSGFSFDKHLSFILPPTLV